MKRCRRIVAAAVAGGFVVEQCKVRSFSDAKHRYAMIFVRVGRSRSARMRVLGIVRFNALLLRVLGWSLKCVFDGDIDWFLAGRRVWGTECVFGVSGVGVRGRRLESCEELFDFY